METSGELSREQAVARPGCDGGAMAETSGRAGAGEERATGMGRRLAVLLLVYGRHALAALAAALRRAAATVLSHLAPLVSPLHLARLVRDTVTRMLRSAPLQWVLRAAAQLVSLRLAVGTDHRSAHVDTRLALLFGILRWACAAPALVTAAASPAWHVLFVQSPCQTPGST
jgi:hypothetical protein